LQGHGHKAIASHGVPVYIPAFADTLAPTHGGMARLSWPGWLVTYRGGLPTCWRQPVSVLTRRWQTLLTLPTNGVTQINYWQPSLTFTHSWVESRRRPGVSWPYAKLRKRNEMKMW